MRKLLQSLRAEWVFLIINGVLAAFFWLMGMAWAAIMAAGLGVGAWFIIPYSREQCEVEQNKKDK